MRSLSIALLALIASASSVPALGGASSFTVVNATGANITSLSIRRFGTNGWQPLSATPASGAQSAVQFSDTDCAFDLQATLAGGASATWSGVNLCEAKLLTLRRSASGEAWVDYD